MAFKNLARREISPHFQALIERGGVTLAEYKELRGNTADWKAIIPALDDEALAHVVEHCAANMYPTSGSYDWSMANELAPEVARRLRAGVEPPVSRVVDVGTRAGDSQPGANMYGCQPCPKCADVFRAVYRRDGKFLIECDECGHKESPFFVGTGRLG